MTRAPEPTSEQRTAIELPADARAYVMAGPGAGKTWTLLSRARLLADRDGIEMSDILVLSFTRAVVRELRRRDSEMHEWASIYPSTFDSFATRLLAEHATDDGWSWRGYDARIALAQQLVASGAADETLSRYRHVLVDEVQDLVGPRADFVASLLTQHEGGFTAFGDPAQAIYDHEYGRGGPSFSDQLRGGLAEHEVLLTGNHRASRELAGAVARVRRALLEEEDGIAAEVAEDALLDLITLGSFEEVPQMVSLMEGDRAVLCRDNATALLLSRALHAEGVDHRVRRGTVDRPVAGWVGAALGPSARVSRAVLAKRLEELRDLGFPGVPADDEAWRVLNKMDTGARGGAIRSSEVGLRIAVGRAPFEVLDEPSHSLVVSSIHRAKGLEFDVCAIVEWPTREDEDVGLEARVRFVALSRARRDCLHAGRRTRRAPWFRANNANNRLIKRGREDWQTFGIELLGDDVHDAEPAGAVLIDHDTPETVQRRLIEDVRPGDPVTLVLTGEHDFGHGSRPVYVVMHEAGPIGITGDRFGATLRRRIHKGAPEHIVEGRVDDLETVKGSIDTGDACGLGRSGLWLRPRLVGLGDFTWKVS